MVEKTVYSLFKQGSKTYFYSSLFFPKYLRNNVFILYAFVRKADNFVDSVPQDREGFILFKEQYHRAICGEKTDDIVIKLFVQLMKQAKINKEWVDDFLESMSLDMEKGVYRTLAETLQYIHGSAEVIGLMMSKLMNLDERAYPYARALGRAMQYINFIRDINEDLHLKRYYLPKDVMKEYGLDSLEEKYVKQHKDAFEAFISKQLDIYMLWQKQAERGYTYIPRIFLIPIKTAADMYKWTSEHIKQNPLIVYEKKMKPSRFYIIFRVMLNTLQSI